MFYKIYADKEDGALILGKQREKDTRQVVFDVTSQQDTLGDGAVNLCVYRAGESDPYNAVNVVREGNTVVWTISEADVAISGYGKVELQYIPENRMYKSQWYDTFVAESGKASGPAPSPLPDWAQSVTVAGAQAKEAAQKAEQSKNAAAESEKAADASKVAAAGSEKAAAGSAVKAETAEKAASGSAQRASVSELAAGGHAENAKKSAEAAASSATAAEKSQAAAAGSAIAAGKSEASAKESISHAPKIVENTWHVWDTVTGKYVNTGVSATERGPIGETGQTGATGAKGDRGERGYSGVYVGSGPKPDGANVQIDPQSKQIIIPEVLQTTGESIEDTMSQKAITENVGLKITGAKPGDTIKVKAVDAEGKPTEWESVAEGKWELIDTIIKSELGPIDVAAEPDGTPYYFEGIKLVIVVGEKNADAWGNIRVGLENGVEFGIASFVKAGEPGFYAGTEIEKDGGCWKIRSNPYGPQSAFSQLVYGSSPAHAFAYTNLRITRVYSTAFFSNGTRIGIYAKRGV